MEFATRYSPQKSVGIEFLEPSMTEQHFKDECDINNIVKQYSVTGVLPSGNRQPLFGDFVGIPQDYAEYKSVMDEAQARFMELPATVRKEFGNDPMALLQFVSNESNREKAISLGLISSDVSSAETVKPSSASMETEKSASNGQ